jgi:hypothetical protein
MRINHEVFPRLDELAGALELAELERLARMPLDLLA